jgi:hypothetical protein
MGRLPHKAYKWGPGQAGATARSEICARLGSPQSRAAARALLASRRATEGEGAMVRLVAIGRHFKFDHEGITNVQVEGRRTSSYFVPISLLREN